MPTTKEELPSTIKRSSQKIQRTYARTLDSAHEQYDSEERAHRTAYAAVKHLAEKKGDHWEPKDSKGPSDPQSRRTGAAHFCRIAGMSRPCRITATMAMNRGPRGSYTM